MKWIEENLATLQSNELETGRDLEKLLLVTIATHMKDEFHKNGTNYLYKGFLYVAATCIDNKATYSLGNITFFNAAPGYLNKGSRLYIFLCKSLGVLKIQDYKDESFKLQLQEVVDLLSNQEIRAKLKMSVSKDKLSELETILDHWKTESKNKLEKDEQHRVKRASMMRQLERQAAAHYMPKPEHRSAMQATL